MYSWVVQPASSLRTHRQPKKSTYLLCFSLILKLFCHTIKIFNRKNLILPSYLYCRLILPHASKWSENWQNCHVPWGASYRFAASIWPTSQGLSISLLLRTFWCTPMCQTAGTASMTAARLVCLLLLNQ